MLPSAVVAAAEIVVGAALYYLLTGPLPWGLTGAAVALNLAEIFGVVATIVWTIVLVKFVSPGNEAGESWQGFSLEAFQVTHCLKFHVHRSRTRWNRAPQRIAWRHLHAVNIRTDTAHSSCI